MAEREVLAHHEPARMEALNEVAIHEFLG